MNPEETNPSIEQAFIQAPKHIQLFITSGALEVFFRKLGGLMPEHLDVQNKVANELLMTLLGVTAPTELATNLKTEAGLTDEEVTTVVQAVNEEVFKPLRAAFEAESREVEPVFENPSMLRVQKPVPTPAPVVPPPPPPIPPPVVVPAPIVPPPPRPAPPPIPVAAPVEQPPVIPTMRTMAHDVEAMKNGTFPVPKPYELHVPPQPAASAVPTPPASSWTPPPMPAPVPPPYHAPEPPHSHVPPVAPTPTTWAPAPMEVPLHPHMPSATPSAADAAHEEVKQSLQKYGIDPYREPPE